MQATLQCPCGSAVFVSITNEMHKLKGRRNEGQYEMEAHGECSACGNYCSNSIFGTLAELTTTTTTAPVPGRF